jgi:hypothetical protein
MYTIAQEWNRSRPNLPYHNTDILVPVYRRDIVQRRTRKLVMPGLVPGIHGRDAVPKTWMAGINPAMTALQRLRECTRVGARDDYAPNTFANPA